MPVLVYHSQKEAPSDAVIWRFLDLRKFRDLMANQELYFRRADLFDDQSEGLPREQYVRRVLRLDPYDIKDQVALSNHLGFLAQNREMYFITCWAFVPGGEFGDLGTIRPRRRSCDFQIWTRDIGGNMSGKHIMSRSVLSADLTDRTLDLIPPDKNIQWSVSGHPEPLAICRAGEIGIST